LEDVLAVDESAAVVEAPAVSAFLDLEDFLAVDESATAVVASAVSAFLDLEVFLEAELSAAVVSAASAFLLFVDFLVLVVSLEVLSEVFFFDLAFAAVVSVWSVD
jgi:hypothetical protein